MKTILTIGMALTVTSAALAQTTPAPQPGICNRACWGASSSSCSTALGSLTRAIIHHTAGSGDFTTDYEAAKARVRGVQNLHKNNNGWCDIGYHFMVSNGGHIFEGRAGSMGGSGDWRKGNHAGCGNNNSMGFTFLGYFHSPYNHSPSTAMQNAMYNVIAWRMPLGWSPYGGRTSYPGSMNGTAAPLDTHSWVGASTGGGCGGTACPGEILINNFITSNFSGGPMRTGIANRRGGTPPPPPPPPRAVVCDFDGDGKTDRAVWRPSNGNWYVYGLGTVQYGVASDIDVSGDYNGDGKIDRAVWRPSTGEWFVQVAGIPVVTYGVSTDIPVPGDYDGDGKTDRAVWRPSTGGWHVQLTGVPVIYYGVSTDIPVPGDYDGNGTTDRAVWRPSTGGWHVQVSGIPVINYGVSTDIPVPGDYDGNGTTDRAVWRPSTGGWHVQVSGIPVINYGGGSDRPVPGDYNGDGKTDRAVFRPSTSEWYVQISGFPTVLYGNGNDHVLALPYAIRRVYFP